MALNVKKIKEDFPIFKNNPNLVYLDNAATTQRPIQVIEAIREFYSNFNANIHRGVYKLSIKATELYEEAHEKIAKFINASNWNEIIFTKNTTDSINIIMNSLANYLNPGDEIVITIMEHHSNMLPWIRLAEMKNLEIKFIEITSEGILKYDQLDKLITKKTKIVSITHVSNVLGTINDIKGITKIVRQLSDALIIIDGAQSVPHMPINVKELDIDFLVFSGHKMLGPTGIGVLWGKEDHLKKLLPPVSGGDMVESVEIIIQNNKIMYRDIRYSPLPWKFEAGTPNIAAGISLAKAVEYLMSVGINNIREHEEILTEYAIKRLNEEIQDEITIIGPKNIKTRGGIITFNIRNLDPHIITSLLSMNNIAIRAGFHCAQPLHTYLGLKRGSARASIYIYNDFNDIDIFVNELKKISKLSSTK